MKKFCAVLAAVMVLGVFSACGNADMERSGGGNAPGSDDGMTSKSGIESKTDDGIVNSNPSPIQ